MISLLSIVSGVRRGLLMALLVFAGHAFAQSTVLYLQSDAGDSIGQGEEKLYQPPQDLFSVTRSFDNGIIIHVWPASAPGHWGLSLAGPDNTALAVGPYEMAARTPFNGTSAGLDVSGNGRGCNKVTGRFVVLDVSYDGAGAVTRFAANFEQHCEGSVPALWGEVRINSTIPLSSQEPAQSTAPDAFAFLPRPQVVASTVLTSNPVTIYGINAPAPIAIVGGTYSVDGGPFTSAAGFVGNRSSVRVRVVSSPTSGGAVSATLTAGGVAASFDATTYQPGIVLSGLYYLSPAGDWVGQGEEVFHIAPDARLDVTSGATLEVTIAGPAGAHWTLRMEPPTGSVLAPDVYAAATRSPTATSPGLDFYGNGRGCNQTSGEFEIFELEFGTGGRVTKLSVDFVQRCEVTGPPLRGEIRFNSAIPFSPFEGAGNTSLPRVAGISTRTQVLTGENVVIGGFVIGGSLPKKVVVRARGPSLAAAGVSNVLFNPVLQLFSGQTPLVGNDDWGTASNVDAIEASGFAPSHAAESAILVTLGPGAYTAIMSGAGGTTGVGIVEVFEVGQPEIPLAGISTRGQVLGGDAVMIGGFVIQGDAPQTVIVRARGPSLASAGVTSFLANPTLQLVRSSDQATIASNDDWGTALNAAQISASGFQPDHPAESAILITLDPGAYTAIVRGSGGATGVGIVEVYTQ